MPKTRPPYSPEFRRQMVDLVRAGRDPAELAREFEPTAQSISHWVAQADRQEGRREEKGGGLTAAERDELVRLRRDLVARINSRAQSAPRSDIYVRRTYSGRPSSSMRFSVAMAMATSVICRPPVRERSASPITRL